jgi:hypothetical protein
MKARPKELKMTKTTARLAGILAAAATLVMAGGSAALAERDHPEDGPHHSAGHADGTVNMRHIDGMVLSKNGDARTFRIRTESGRALRIRVSRTTEFERIAGFAGLHRGLAIEVNVRRTPSGLLATKVETRRGGGGNGADDPAGDDHGGHGADDGPNHT